MAVDGPWNTPGSKTQPEAPSSKVVTPFPHEKPRVHGDYWEYRGSVASHDAARVWYHRDRANHFEAEANRLAQHCETNDKRVITEEIRIGSTVCKPGCRLSTVLNRIERGFQFAEARRDPSIVGVVPALQEAPVETEAPPASHREVRGILAGYTPVETAENSVERRARDNFNLSHGIDAGAWDRQHESEKDRWRDAARRQVKATCSTQEGASREAPSKEPL